MRRNLRLDWRALALLGALLSIIIDWSGLVYTMPSTLPPAIAYQRQHRGSTAATHLHHHLPNSYHNYASIRLSSLKHQPFAISNLNNISSNKIVINNHHMSEHNTINILSNLYSSMSPQELHKKRPSSHSGGDGDGDETHTRNSTMVRRSSDSVKSKRLNNNKNNLDRNERSTLSHLSGPSRKIQLYIKNRFIQLMPDGTVNGTQDEQSEYTILQRSSLDVGRIKIQGVATCLYLCMDPCGTVYGSKEFNDDCVFNENMELHNYNTYSSTFNSNARRKLYLALNRHGEPRRLQIPPNRSLGKLATYTNAITETVPQERVEQLIAKNFGANRIKHGIRQLCDTGKPLIELIDGQHFKARPKCNTNNSNANNNSSSSSSNSSSSFSENNNNSNLKELLNNKSFLSLNSSSSSSRISTLTNTSNSGHLSNTNVPAVVNKSVLDVRITNSNNNSSSKSSWKQNSNSSSYKSNSNQVSLSLSENSGHTSDSTIIGKTASHQQIGGGGWKKKKKKRKCRLNENEKEHNCQRPAPQAMRKKSQVLGPKRAQKCRDLLLQQQQQQQQTKTQEILLPPMCHKMRNHPEVTPINHRKSKKLNSGGRPPFKQNAAAKKRGRGAKNGTSQTKKRTQKHAQSKNIKIFNNTLNSSRSNSSRSINNNIINSTRSSKNAASLLVNPNIFNNFDRLSEANTSDRGEREERNVHFSTSIEDFDEILPIDTNAADHEHVTNSVEEGAEEVDGEDEETEESEKLDQANQEDNEDNSSYEDEALTINMASEAPLVNAAEETIYYDQLDL